MQARNLAVASAVEFTPDVFLDQRGLFVSPFQAPTYNTVFDTGLFPVAQSSLNRSRRGVVRGLHFTRTPPGMARYVHCPRGRALDFVVDIRQGSPTLGACDAVELDDTSFRAVYLPVGVGHAFVALEDDTIVSYLLSQSYDPANEHSLSVLDPELGLCLPDTLGLVMSDRDREAPTLAQARSRGLLPDYATCQDLERALSATSDARHRTGGARA